MMYDGLDDDPFLELRVLSNKEAEILATALLFGENGPYIPLDITSLDLLSFESIDDLKEILSRRIHGDDTLFWDISISTWKAAVTVLRGSFLTTGVPSSIITGRLTASADNMVNHLLKYWNHWSITVKYHSLRQIMNQLHMNHALCGKLANLHWTAPILQIFKDIACNSNNSTHIAAHSVACICELLAHFTLSGEGRDIIVVEDTMQRFIKDGGCQLLILLLKQFQAESNVVMQSCRLITNLTVNHPEILGVVRNCSGIEQIVSALHDHSNNDEVVRHGVATLWRLAQNHPSNQSHMGDCGTCELLLKLLLQHFDSIDVVKQITVAIATITAHDSNNIMKIHAFVTTEKNASKDECEIGTEILLRALKRYHCGSPLIVDCMCQTLLQITSVVDEEDDQSIESIIGNYGCCEIIISALEQNNVDHSTILFSPDESSSHGPILIVRNACLLLRNLTTSSDENRIRIGRCNGCSVLIETLKGHSDDVDLVEYICGAMWNVAVHEENEKTMISLGCCELLIQCLRKHYQVSRVVIQICGTLENLASSLSGKDVIARHGGLELMVTLLKFHIDSDELVCTAVCSLLQILLSNATTSDLEIVKNTGGEELIEKILKKYGTLQNNSKDIFISTDLIMKSLNRDPSLFSFTQLWNIFVQLFMKVLHSVRSYIV